MSDPTAAAAAVVRGYLTDSELDWSESAPNSFVVTLPGVRKQATTCSLVVGGHTVSVNAFVARRPEENQEAVYHWLLRRNLRSHGPAFALDPLGDIYLAGKVPLAELSAATVDRLLGAVLETADESFNTILELGFAGAIRREWDWRLKRGEPTTNLAAFAHLLERTD
ncbi:MAG: YbjN domain-containing protein [Sporichthyaceae bacterium]|nr:YbjN domain-containing protein [Sporichthyaceae bacterium]